MRTLVANPFAMSRTFHKIGHVTNTTPWRLLPTPNGLAVVTTTGRKTGKRRVRAMRAVRDGQHVYAVALMGPRTDWVRNIAAQPYVTIKLGSRTYEGVGRVVADAGERARAELAYRPIAGWFDYFDYANFVWSVPTSAKLLRAHDGWFNSGTLVAFDLKEADTQ